MKFWGGSYPSYAVCSSLGRCEKSHVDVKMFNPHAPTNRSPAPRSIYRRHENRPLFQVIPASVYTKYFIIPYSSGYSCILYKLSKRDLAIVSVSYQVGTISRKKEDANIKHAFIELSKVVPGK